MEATGKIRIKRTRVNFTSPQLQALETIFAQAQYPDVTVVEALAQRLDLPVEKICTWFQNRRSKFRRDCKRGHIELMREQMFHCDKSAATSCADSSQKPAGKSVSESDKKDTVLGQISAKPQPSTRYNPYGRPSSSQSRSTVTPNARWMNQQQYWQQTAAYQPNYNHVNQGGYNSASHLPYNLTPQQMASLYYNPALPGYPSVSKQSTGYSTMSPTVTSEHPSNNSPKSSPESDVIPTNYGLYPSCYSTYASYPGFGVPTPDPKLSSSMYSTPDENAKSPDFRPCSKMTSNAPGDEIPTAPMGGGESSTSGSCSGSPDLPVLDYSSSCLYSNPGFMFMYNNYNANYSSHTESGIVDSLAS